jgi:signal transduction histidine kinase
MLEKILINLISNAIKFSDPESRIEIIVKKKTNHSITVSVKDYGIGISPEDQKTIFQKYKQTKSATIIRNQGSGIGLHIVKTFVEKMGFSIECKSELNVGSEFIITIPVSGIVTGCQLSDKKAYIPSPTKLEKLAIEFSDCF